MYIKKTELEIFQNGFVFICSLICDVIGETLNVLCLWDQGKKSIDITVHENSFAGFSEFLIAPRLYNFGSFGTRFGLSHLNFN